MEEEILSFFFQGKGEIVLNIDGFSMGREVARHGSIYVYPLDNPPKRGDVLLIKLGESYVVHRMISKINEKDKKIITKGDNCVTADMPVSYKDIIGLVKGLKKDNNLWIPWHWRWPFSYFIATWSGLEARFWKQFSYPFVVVRKLRYIIR
jgi:hypothetical protein